MGNPTAFRRRFLSREATAGDSLEWQPPRWRGRAKAPRVAAATAGVVTTKPRQIGRHAPRRLRANTCPHTCRRSATPELFGAVSVYLGLTSPGYRMPSLRDSGMHGHAARPGTYVARLAHADASRLRKKIGALCPTSDLRRQASTCRRYLDLDAAHFFPSRRFDWKKSLSSLPHSSARIPEMTLQL